jgi:hypothetical protein
VGFVSADADDVFVSYARVDDQPEEGVRDGWVTALVKSLHRGLAREIGRPDAFSVFMDHQLSANTLLSEELRRRVRGAAVLLVVLSKGYLASEWCGRELQAFLAEEVGRRRGPGRSGLFVVEYDEVTRPPALADQLALRFWERDAVTAVTRTYGFPAPSPADTEYYTRVAGLGKQIAAELLARKPAATGAAPAPRVAGVPAADGPAVFLAECTDDLDRQRNKVRDYLHQAGYRVVPDRQYPADAAAFAAAVTADLGPALVFAQLLGPYPGEPLEGSGAVRAVVQFDAAKAAGKPWLQWRSPTIPADEADLDLDPGPYRDLITRYGPDSMAGPLPRFMEAVVGRAKAALVPPPPPPPAPAGGCFVFLNTARDDADLVAGIKKELEAQKVAHAVPLETDDLDEYNQDLEDQLKRCDGVILVYGRTGRRWVRSQLGLSSKFVRDDARPVIGVYDVLAPKPDADLGVWLPNLHVFQCHAPPPYRDQIAEFVRKVRESKGGKS